MTDVSKGSLLCDLWISLKVIAASANMWLRGREVSKILLGVPFTLQFMGMLEGNFPPSGKNLAMEFDTL